MARTKLSDLNNLLFEQLEKLRDCENEDVLITEVKRAKSINDTAEKILNIAGMALEAEKLCSDNAYLKIGKDEPKLLG